MQGRRVIVTGATAGVGKETARALVRKGADVVVVGRDAKKIDETVRELRAEAKGSAVDAVRCDLSSLASVREAASELVERFPAIHVLVNNAGAVHMERSVTKDGFETTFQSNHLGPYVLTRRLLPKLLAGTSPTRTARIVNVASVVHSRGVIDFSDLQTERAAYVGLGVYSRTKLMNVLFTYALARRLRSHHVTANCLHPGVIASGFGHNNGGWMGFGVKLVAPFLWTPEKGARTSVKLASSSEVEGVTGKYYDERSRERPSSVTSHDVALQETLWKTSAELAGEPLEPTFA
ncbi:MAG: SDR family oxidoreductase [Sandaracinus sp.]